MNNAAIYVIFFIIICVCSGLKKNKKAAEAKQAHQRQKPFVPAPENEPVNMREEPAASVRPPVREYPPVWGSASEPAASASFVSSRETGTDWSGESEEGTAMEEPFDAQETAAGVNVSVQTETADASEENKELLRGIVIGEILTRRPVRRYR